MKMKPSANKVLTALRRVSLGASFGASLVLICLIALGAKAHAAEPLNCQTIFDSPAPAKRLDYLAAVAGRFAPLDQSPTGPRVRILLGAIEVGKIPGLSTTDGKPLNLSVGGIGTVMNDTWSAKAPALAARGIETVAVTPLMRNIKMDGLDRIGTVTVRIEGRNWKVQIYHFRMASGGHVLFLENEHFTQRFDAIPLRNSNIYEMRDLPDGKEGELEQQRIWSALSQATAKVYKLIGADAYIPQDGHIAPASYYIDRLGENALTLAPVIHNELYFESYDLDDEDQVASIWNVSKSKLDKYFKHDDQFVMMAPAIRTAARKGLFTGKSVSNNTTRVLNRDGLPADAFPRIDLFSRLAPEENFLANSNRPEVNVGLAHATREQLMADGISATEVINTYATPDGYQFGGQHAVGIVEGKARAKRAVQLTYDLDLDPNKPLFVSFARLVEQKGMDFLVPNIRRILEGGGQIVVGGPVGDESGAATQAAFKRLKKRLMKTRPDIAHGFVVIEGPVMGRMKALLLAAQDFFPVPSRFEPCGLTDVEALFMGGQPIAPRIGGLVKAKNTIKYATDDPENQADDLGWGIDQAFRLYNNYHDLFLRRQVDATREDFSLERHLNQVLKNQRVEIYYQIITELDQQVAARKLSATKAREYIRVNILEKHPEDRAYLISSLRRLRSSRGASLRTWLIKQD